MRLCRPARFGHSGAPPPAKRGVVAHLRAAPADRGIGLDLAGTTTRRGAPGAGAPVALADAFVFPPSCLTSAWRRMAARRRKRRLVEGGAAVRRAGSGGWHRSAARGHRRSTLAALSSAPRLTERTGCPPARSTGVPGCRPGRSRRLRPLLAPRRVELWLAHRLDPLPAGRPATDRPLPAREKPSACTCAGLKRARICRCSARCLISRSACSAGRSGRDGADVRSAVWTRSARRWLAGRRRAGVGRWSRSGPSRRRRAGRSSAPDGRAAAPEAHLRAATT